ncbi:MAG: VWA domain-containing protein [Caldilineaceae bacterium]|nr:VWA domain-containing protein [Caldilineaceae bacterium]
MPTQQKVYLLVEVQPTGVGLAGRMPLNFGLVLDRSGSMAGEKINNLRAAVKLLVGQLGAQDLVSLVVFDDKVDLLVPSQPVIDVARLQAAVENITDRGGTTMSKGMRAGLTELRKNLAPNKVSRLILLTDGETYGDEEQCKQIATECGQAGIPISAFGLGDEWNADLLDAIAQNSGGLSDLLVTPDKIAYEFQQTRESAQNTVATNANLTLRLVTGVTPVAAWRVLPQITRMDARNLSDRSIQIFLGELERNTGQALLVELVVQPKAAGTYRIAQADVMYDIPAQGIVGEHSRQDVMLTLTSDPTQVSPQQPDVMNLVEKVSAFKLYTRALTEAQAGNIAGATQKLQTAATRLLDMGEADLAQVAQAEATNLQQQGAMSALGTKKLQYGTRKLTQRLDDTDG